ncbi:TnpV protein [Enterocloster bolteae]|uniref:TnpV protein n=1 Tax=Enterocloster bolteae TaxID=208479 RepID=UPI003A7F301D
MEIEGSELLKNLGKYRQLRLKYLHRFKKEIYRELLFTGKLAEQLCHGGYACV